MDATVTSLFWISLVAVASPLLAGFVPRRLVSEVVLLLGFGILIGPYGLELAAMDAPIDLLRELGLAFLFLLAGFEVELRELTGRAGGPRPSPGWVACCWPSGSSPCSGSPRCWTPRSRSRSR